MNTSCPRCGSHLDPATDICEGCSWAVPYRVRPTPPQDPTPSFSERYGSLGDRGGGEATVMVHARVAPGRVFVVLSLLAVSAMLGIVVLGVGTP